MSGSQSEVAWRKIKMPQTCEWTTRNVLALAQLPRSGGGGSSLISDYSEGTNLLSGAQPTTELGEIKSHHCIKPGAGKLYVRDQMVNSLGLEGGLHGLCCNQSILPLQPKQL